MSNKKQIIWYLSNEQRAKLEKAKSYFKDLHDNKVNQKYAEYLACGGVPYSFHLEMVEIQIYEFAEIILSDPDYFGSLDEKELMVILIISAWAHDAIEDARMTYNDVKNEFGVLVAEIVYCCTELRGKNRAERHGIEFFETLTQNKMAIFIKLCDIIANTKFGLLTRSSMLPKYAAELPKLKSHITDPIFSPMLMKIEKIIQLGMENMQK